MYLGSYAWFYSFRLECCSQISGSWIATSEKVDKGKMYGRIPFTLSSSLIKAYYWRLSSKKGIYGQFHIIDITFRGQFFGNRTLSYMLLFKVPVSSKFVFLIWFYTEQFSYDLEMFRCEQNANNRLNKPKSSCLIRTNAHGLWLVLRTCNAF